jgi:hypothetical protein
MSEAPQQGPRIDPAFWQAIRQFRHEIGAFHAIPTPSPTLARPTLKHSNGRKLTAVLCILILAMAVLHFASRLAGPDTIPAHLVGSWATNEPSYEGRYLELTRDSLILRSSASEATRYGVQSVQRRQISGGSSYAVTAYSEPSGDYTVTLEYHEAHETIALGRPARVVWHRAR